MAGVKRAAVLALLIAASTTLTPAAHAVGGGPYIGDSADSTNVESPTAAAHAARHERS